MKYFKIAIATIALFAFILPVEAQDRGKGKGKGKGKAKQSQGMKAKKAKGNNRYKVTPQNHGQYVKQLRMASKRLKDLMKGKKKKHKWKNNKDHVHVDSTIIEVARNIDAMLYRMEHAKDADFALLNIELMVRQQRQALQTISNVSKIHFDASLDIILQIGF